jgi:hypothetical protein
MLKERRWKAVALLAAGMVVGISMVGTPAGAHVGGTVNHLWNHLKPKADKRYLPGQNLPSGKTIRGAYMLGDTAGAGGDFTVDGYTFLQQLASEPTPHYIPAGDAAPSACPGTVFLPKAGRGHLCIYEASKNNATFSLGNPTNNSGGEASRWGFYLQIQSIASGLYWSNGTWAVTAP